MGMAFEGSIFMCGVMIGLLDTEAVSYWREFSKNGHALSIANFPAL